MISRKSSPVSISGWQGKGPVAGSVPLPLTSLFSSRRFCTRESQEEGSSCRERLEWALLSSLLVSLLALCTRVFVCKLLLSHLWGSSFLLCLPYCMLLLRFALRIDSMCMLRSGPLQRPPPRCLHSPPLHQPSLLLLAQRRSPPDQLDLCGPDAASKNLRGSVERARSELCTHVAFRRRPILAHFPFGHLQLLLIPSSDDSNVGSFKSPSHLHFRVLYM